MPIVDCNDARSCCNSILTWWDTLQAVQHVLTNDVYSSAQHAAVTFCIWCANTAHPATAMCTHQQGHNRERRPNNKADAPSLRHHQQQHAGKLHHGITLMQQRQQPRQSTGAVPSSRCKQPRVVEGPHARPTQKPSRAGPNLSSLLGGPCAAGLQVCASAVGISA